MSLRDLTARSSQARSDISDEALEKGKAIYRSIIDDGDADELQRFKRLAAASAKMERPVQVEQRNGKRVGLASRLATAVVAIVVR